MARDWRVHHPGLPTEAGSEIELSREESHHLLRVLRLGAGDRVRVFDGRGSEWSATVIATDDRRARARLDAPVTEVVEAPVRVALFQGLCRPDKMDWIVQKATELGVAAIHPWAARRSNAPSVSARRLERWVRIAIEAAKQSGRRVVPIVEARETLPAPGAGGRAILLDPDPGAPPLARALGGDPAGRLALAVGPEPGFDDDERALAVGAGWRPGGLGPRILRTETAGIVAVALALHLRGDLGGAV